MVGKNGTAKAAKTYVLIDGDDRPARLLMVDERDRMFLVLTASAQMIWVKPSNTTWLLDDEPAPFAETLRAEYKAAGL